MKYAIFTVMTPDWDIAETITNLAKLGYDGIEWRVNEPANAALKARIPEAMHKQARYWLDNKATLDPTKLTEIAPELTQQMAEAGLEFCSLGTYVEAHQLAEIETIMQGAKALGAPRIRVGTPSYDRSRNYNDLFAETTEHLKGVQDLARQYGVAAAVETHFGNITASASLAHRLVSQFDPDYIGVLYDPGNLVYEGYENWRMGLELLGPYLHEVHAKNALWERIDDIPADRMMMPIKPSEKQAADGTTLWNAHFAELSKGIVNWQQIMDDLKAIGYDGWIAFEDFSQYDADTREKCQQNLTYLKNYE